MYDFKNVETNNGIVYLEPGLHDVKVEAVVADIPDGKSPKIAITFTNGNGSTVQNFYMSEKATPRTLENLKHVMAACSSEKEAETVKGADLTTLAEAIGGLIIGKECSIKLRGEFYNGNLRAKFGFAPFATAKGEGLLKFNPATDIEKDTSGDMIEGLGAPAMTGGDALPEAIEPEFG